MKVFLLPSAWFPFSTNLGWCTPTCLSCPQIAHGPLWPSMASLWFISSHCYFWNSSQGLTHFLRSHLLLACDSSSSVPYSVRFAVQMDPTEFSAMIMKRCYLLLLTFCNWGNPLTFLPIHLTTGYFPNHLLLFSSSSVPTAFFQKCIPMNSFFVWFLDSFSSLKHKRIKKLSWKRQDSIAGKELRGQ